MDELVKMLSEGEHPVVVEDSAKDLKDMIDRDYVLVKFTGTKGGTELGFPLDKEKSDLEKADWDKGEGSVTVAGALNLNYVDVRCEATIDLATLKGEGHLVVLE